MTIFVPSSVLGQCLNSQPGSISAPAKIALGIIKALRDEEIVIAKSSEGRAVFGTVELNTSMVEETPSPWRSLHVEEVDVGFLRALRAVVFAASDDPTRRCLNGVFYDCGNGQSCLVAIDGYRMASITTPQLFVSGGKAKGDHIIIPRQAATLINEMGKKFIGHKPRIGFVASTEIPTTFEGKFQIGPASLIFKCLNEKFLVYIPAHVENKIIINIERECLKKALKTAGSMGKVVKIVVNTVLRFDTETADIGKVSQGVEAKINPENHAELTTAVNIKYLPDGCEHFPESRESDEIEITLDADHPVGPIHLKANDMTYLVMPARL